MCPANLNLPDTGIDAGQFLPNHGRRGHLLLGLFLLSPILLGLDLVFVFVEILGLQRVDRVALRFERTLYLFAMLLEKLFRVPEGIQMLG
jgi:hypothetical protein